jgi:prepilin-type N-terminal cleavage/methylation domain-containing protein/prepilin-type processing-associated H-X9-DG protein
MLPANNIRYGTVNLNKLPTDKPKSFGRVAFTLIELLVVIAIIAILAAILMPVLQHAEERATQIGCLNNLQQLMIGWRMYADDNKEFPPNEDYNAYPRWVAGDMRGGTIAPLAGAPTYSGIDATNGALLVEPHYSCMGPYVANPKIYRCPADQSTWTTVNSPGVSEKPRVRSYSMNQAVGPCENGTLVGQDVMGHWMSSGNAGAPGGSPWRVFFKDSTIQGMSPSDLFVLLDEHPESINDAAFAVQMPLNPAQTFWIDTPSRVHNNSNGFSFADGHAEIHKWQLPSELPNVVWTPDSAPNEGGAATAVPNDPDVLWVCHRTSCLASGVNGKSIYQP